ELCTMNSSSAAIGLCSALTSRSALAICRPSAASTTMDPPDACGAAGGVRRSPARVLSQARTLSSSRRAQAGGGGVWLRRLPVAGARHSEVGAHAAGAEDRDADAVRRQLRAQHLAEAGGRVLRRRVEADVEEIDWDDAGHRSGVDDVRLASLRLQARHEGAA